MLPTQDTTHVQDGLATRIGEYLSDANLAGLLTAVLMEVQAIEDMLWQVIGSQLLTRTFPPGTGQGELDGPPDQALIQVAQLVGAPIGTYTTRQLALLVGLWISADSSDGSTLRIASMLVAAFGPSSPYPATELAYLEAWPAAFQLFAIDVSNSLLIPPVAQALAIARPAGVYATLSWSDASSWSPASAIFYFGDSNAAPHGGSGLKDTHGDSSAPAKGLLSSVVT